MAEKAVKEVVEELLNRVTTLENETGGNSNIKKLEYDFKNTTINSVQAFSYDTDDILDTTGINVKDKIISVIPCITETDGSYFGDCQYQQFYQSVKGEEFDRYTLVVQVNQTYTIRTGIIIFYTE